MIPATELLIEAAEHGPLQRVEALLGRGAPACFLPIHGHSTALHQAALTDDPELIALLLDHGARRDVRDTVWDDTPLDWTIHEECQRARDFLSA